MIGGAWPFLVRGVICLLNCVSNIFYYITSLQRSGSLTDNHIFERLESTLFGSIERNGRDRESLLNFSIY